MKTQPYVHNAECKPKGLHHYLTYHLLAGPGEPTIEDRQATLAAGIKCTSSPNVLKDTHGHGCYRSRLHEYQYEYLMTDSPTARPSSTQPTPTRTN